MMTMKVPAATFRAKIIDVVDTQNQFNNFKHCESMQKIKKLVSLLYKSNTKQKGEIQNMSKLEPECIWAINIIFCTLSSYSWNRSVLQDFDFNPQLREKATLAN